MGGARFTRTNNSMDQITIKTPNPKCRLYWCLTEFVDWRYSQLCWYFRPLLWTSAPLIFSLVHLLPPPPFPVWISTVVCIYTVCNGGGGGEGIRLCGEHIQELYTVFLTHRAYKIALPPHKKNLGGEGASDRLNTCHQVPLVVNF